MMVSQLLVAAGLLCFAAATPSHWQWLIGAWMLWIAYAGLNLCLPNLMLKLSPRDANTPYIAAFDAVRGLCYAASTILGGALLDHCRTWTFSLCGVELSFFPCLFLLGWATRSLGAAVLLLVIEPAAHKKTPRRQGGEPTRR
jgi:MFS family permease